MISFSSAALRARRVGFFGGSFDPPHRGHLFVAREAVCRMDLDAVVWAPARCSPHKTESQVAGSLRAEMVELCLEDAREQGDPAAQIASVWRGEFERAGPSYTVDSLRGLRDARTACGVEGGIYLVMGGDQVGAIETWHELDALLAMARPVIVPRVGQAPAARLDGCVQRGELSAGARDAIATGCLATGRVDLAATDLRRGIRDGAEAEDGLTPRVLELIQREGIYR